MELADATGFAAFLHKLPGVGGVNRRKSLGKREMPCSAAAVRAPPQLYARKTSMAFAM
jgi:hypothetical protein